MCVCVKMDDFINKVNKIFEENTFIFFFLLSLLPSVMKTMATEKWN